jgi:hypothetical protein
MRFNGPFYKRNLCSVASYLSSNVTLGWLMAHSSRSTNLRSMLHVKHGSMGVRRSTQRIMWLLIIKVCSCCNPTLRRVWGWNSHSRKGELGNPLGLPKFQSSIVGVKTPRIGTLFISLESYQIIDVENGFAWTIWNINHKLWQKEKSGVKLTIWLPTTKSQESTRPRCVQVECNTSLKRSQRELQVCFRPHPNRRSKQRVMTPQSGKSLNRDSFETPPWESWE